MPELNLSDATLRGIALRALKGVGDEGRGAIADERGRLSYQVRRRLSEEEEALIGAACDIRQTEEAQKRYERALRWLRPEFRAMAWQEVSL